MTPELDFRVINTAPVPFCVTPTLGFMLRVTASGGEPVQAVALDCQVRIEAQNRRYGDLEKERLVELFGAPSEWSRTLRSLLWTHAAASIPTFAGSTEVELRVPCTYDFNVIAAKYFHAVEEGEVPLLLLFSGSVFYGGDESGLQVTRIPWTKEAEYSLPVQVWKDLMEIYYPNVAWLSLRRDVFDRLAVFKGAHTMPTWEEAIDRLLDAAAERARR
jgi:hypothetical protein